MHLNSVVGHRLHKGVGGPRLPVRCPRRVLTDVSEQRRPLVDIPDDIDSIAKKREILADVRSKTKDLSPYADLLSGGNQLRGQRSQGRPGVSGEGVADGLPGRDGVEADGDQVGVDAAVSPGRFQGAEAVGDLQVDFGVA